MNIAILEYEIIFNPDEAWSNGSQFESQFSDFFAAFGFEAQIIETRGGTGKRVIFINRINEVPEIKEAPQQSLTQEVKQVQSKKDPQTYKKFITKPTLPQGNTPKLTFQRGSQNSQQVTKPPITQFRKVK